MLKDPLGVEELVSSWLLAIAASRSRLERSRTVCVAVMRGRAFVDEGQMPWLLSMMMGLSWGREMLRS
jgi:hypothetical protein